MTKTVLLLASMAVALVVACGAVMAATPIGTIAVTDQGTLDGARGRDAALDRALEDLVAMRGGPPGVIAVVQRGKPGGPHRRGANSKTGRSIGVNDRMRIASTAKAFSGAVALSLVSKGTLSLNDTIGDFSDCPSRLPKPGTRSPSDSSSTTPAACRITPRTPASGKRSRPASHNPPRPRNCSRT